MPTLSSLGPFTTFVQDTEETIKLAYVSGPMIIAASPTTVADMGALTSSAPAAVTSAQNATTNAATQSGSYVQVDVQTIATLANALKVSYNAAQADIAALRTALAATQADVASLRTALLALSSTLRTEGFIA